MKIIHQLLLWELKEQNLKCYLLKTVKEEKDQESIEKYDVNELTVNEQNPNAKGFYEHMGFKTYKRAELAEQGNPYPILYMRLEK